MRVYSVNYWVIGGTKWHEVKETLKLARTEKATRYYFAHAPGVPQELKWFFASLVHGAFYLETTKWQILK